MNTKRINWSKSILLLLTISIIAFSCKSDDDTVEPDKGQYVVSFQANPIGQNRPVDYLLTLPSIESLTTGEISVEGKGIELKGWNYFHGANNTIFTTQYTASGVTTAYQLNEAGKLTEVNNFSTPSAPMNFINTDDKKMIAVELLGSLDDPSKGIPNRDFNIINTDNGMLEKKVNHAIDSNDGKNEGPAYIPWVTGMVQNGGKLFVSYHKLPAAGTYNPIQVEEKAHVAIFKYPSFEFEKLIEDDRTSPIGTNGHVNGIEKTENGDIYSYSSSATTCALAGATKPSGILKIKNGATTFDPDYFFDVENATNGGKIFWMDYVGNNKALARIILDDTIGPWGVYNEQGPFFKLVVIDLVQKTVTDVQGLSPHANRYTAPLFVENGIAYLSSRVGGMPIGPPVNGDIKDGTSHIYIVNPETATATKGAKINGLSIKGIFKISN
ncbi:DUF4374 domain-containing protein [Aquimarina hainanensis]|uniref:DUF4374 domain-containing protein n=1 Tax=Aquimarina hainanensis TaxID=1578017 RepID=A0ABW5NA07_9FLAO|nr:DUF4374 domain-containing protein [Aquimarina sp. TRL1]QKX03689.1 DUF4374 domain-containing protein [Aquimarina sp. TRL1]